MVGERGPGLVRVQVEERVGLAADEVVAAGGAAAGDADGLRVGEGGFQGFVVDGCDSVGAEAEAEEDQGGLDFRGGWVGGDGAEGVFVDVRGVRGHVDAEVG